MVRGVLCTMALSCLVVALAGVSQADVPQLINYQGRLTDAAGKPVNDTVKLGFGFYGRPDPPPIGEDAMLLYYEEQAVQVQQGIFNVLIGNGTNQKGSFDKITSTDTVYLQVFVDPDNVNPKPGLMPRQRIASVAFALRAGTSDAVETLEARVATLEKLLAHFSRDDNNIYIDGANLHIRNKMDATETTNGVGNLIVGYNEWRDVEGGGIRTGSHNVIVGAQQDFSSYGAMVAGRFNSSYGPYASVTGGEGNTASGAFASVTGGRCNSAEGSYASVAGGGGDLPASGNKAFGHYTAILGGQENVAGDVNLKDHGVGLRSTVSGGRANNARGPFASVSGGNSNTAGGQYSSVSGGFHSTASGIFSSVSGGRYNAASADSASVSAGDGNTASAEYASVSGGRNNEAAGECCSVSGGSNNEAGLWYSANDCTSVSGGWNNKANGDHSSVSGGSSNTAAGSMSSVSGGREKKVTASYQWRAGDLWTDAMYHFPICTELEITGGGGAP